MQAPITIDIWSDIACPWCSIGKRRLESAIDQFGRIEPEARFALTYRSFELSPDTPVDFEGSEVDFLVGHKAMPADRVARMLEHVATTAAEVGLDYDFDSLRHTNTVRAHQLLHLAKAHGLQLEAAERLFAAYFSEGRHLGHVDELVALGSEVGLDAHEIADALDTDKYLAAVRDDQDEAVRLGITGVPFHVVQGRYGVSGAQDPAVFIDVFQRVLADRTESVEEDHEPAGATR